MNKWLFIAIICLGTLCGSQAFPVGILQQTGYTYRGGMAPEKELDPNQVRVTVGTWNICGTHLSQTYGGVIHWQFRLPGIVEKVRAEDPDVMIFQEVYDPGIAEALVQALQDRYAHFFLYLGPNPIGAVGGCMVLSKLPIHNFSNTSFVNNTYTLNRGFATLDIKAKPSDSAPVLRIVGTHIMYGYTSEDIVKREAQVEQIKARLSSTAPCPTIIAADFNIEREDPILSFLEHGYQGKESTCMTTGLIRHWNPKAEGPEEEWIDNISLVKGSKGNIEARLVQGFDPKTLDVNTALSDHHMLVGTYSSP